MSETYFNIEKFGNRLKSLMEEHDLTTYALAEAVYLAPATISRYANAKMEPKRSTVEVLAKYFNVNPAWLMGNDVEKRINGTKYKRVPILGQIAAGQPISAIENIEGYEFVSQHEGVGFCLRVKGDSMIGARIFDGDIVFIREQGDVENGEIAAIIIDNEVATLKRVYKQNGAITLHSENPTIPDMRFTPRDRKQIRIIGKVKYVKFEAR